MIILKLLKSEIFWLSLILIIGFLVRFYKIDNPVADWHSWRQADTAAVARNFYKEGYNPFLPKYDDMTGVAEKPIPNKERYRFVEFPFYNSLVYFSYLINGGVDERLARLVNIVISLGSTVFVYLLAKRYFGVPTGLLASFIFALLPFNIFFSRVILPDPMLVFLSLGMVYFLDWWIRDNKRWLFVLSFIFTAGALLVKPYAIFYGVGLVYSFYLKEGKFWPLHKRYLVFLLVALLPLFFWRLWINQHPEGIPASNWLLNGNNIRFKPIFWKWIIQDRLGREILSVCGTVLFFIGGLVKPRVKEGYFLHLLLLGMVLFLIVFATGNVQHDYYQTFIIPALAIFVARGFILLMEGIPGFLPRLFTIPLGLLFLIMMFYLTWGEVKGLYQVNNPDIVEAGRVADKILPKDAVVVAPYNGDTSFLYQTNRPGWPVVALPIKDLHDLFGVNYYISTTKDAKTKWMMRKYATLVETPKYVIVDITREIPGFDRIYDIEP